MIELVSRKSTCRVRVPSKQDNIPLFSSCCFASPKKAFTWTLRTLLVLWLLFPKCTTALRKTGHHDLVLARKKQTQSALVSFSSLQQQLFEPFTVACGAPLTSTYLRTEICSIFFLLKTLNHTVFSSIILSNYFSGWSKGKTHFISIHNKVSLAFSGDMEFHFNLYRLNLCRVLNSIHVGSFAALKECNLTVQALPWLPFLCYII